MTRTTTPTMMLRFTAAAALVLFAAMPATAQLGGAAGALGGLGAPELPVGIPEVPDLPISAGAGLPGVSAHADGANAQACIDTEAARAAARDARAQAEGAARSVAAPLAPVTSQADAAKAQVEAAASPVTSLVPEPDTSLSHCIDSDDPEGSATGAAAKAQSKASSLVGQIKGFFGSLRGALPF